MNDKEDSADSSDDKAERDISCPACLRQFVLTDPQTAKEIQYCVFCGAVLLSSSDESSRESQSQSSPSLSSGSSPSFVQGHLPTEEAIQFTVGPYQVLMSIGRGGMGEVFLAYDTICGRRIALKKIRSDLLDHPQLHNRFLKEAHITSQLTHPAIIPIYTIHQEANLIYYTMPFVEGQTLKQVLRQAKEGEKNGEKSAISESSIPTLVRLFIQVCQAISYAHSKGVLHRDLKPENIIVGKFGEVMILDWGLAKLMAQHGTIKLQEHEENAFSLLSEQEKHPLHELTHIGKIVGTASYMAPERALGHHATIQTDIYALGVILYQILTLKLPFQRKSLRDFRKNWRQEQFVDPAEVAPYRDVPKMLSRVVEKCLEAQQGKRYASVGNLIHDLESYIEGRSEWFQLAQLNIHQKADWEFQEHVLIAEHMAIMRHAEESEWVNLMISKSSFAQNMKVEAKVQLGLQGEGVGFLLGIPEAAERAHLNDGYYLWLSSDLNKSTKLLRSTVEVVSAPEVFLTRGEQYRIRIEKLDHNIYFFLNDVLQFSYISHLPLVGTHIGFLSRDSNFELSDIFVYVGGQSIMVNCLAVPDAFLGHKDYVTALSEYRRIGYSFPGRAEGRDAMFRAGITLLEQGRNQPDPEASQQDFELALQEFEKLHNTPGAPLEYLGKALVYHAMQDYEEEIKCFELGYRRYPHHPLLPVLQEQIVYRMHDMSRRHRRGAYEFILLVVKHLSDVAKSSHTKKLFANLQKHWEPLFFIERDPFEISSHDPAFDRLKALHFGILIAFWLAKPHRLLEFLNEVEAIILKSEDAALINLGAIALGNGLFCLIELGSWSLAEKKASEIHQKEQIQQNPTWKSVADALSIAILSEKDSLAEAIAACPSEIIAATEKRQLRVNLYLMEAALRARDFSAVHTMAQQLASQDLSSESRLQVDSLNIWAYLWEKDWKHAGELLYTYPLSILSKETSILYFLYGCWLCITEGQEIANIHFSAILDVAYPPSWTLFAHYLKGKIGQDERWMSHAFLWEKRQLYRQLALFYYCTGELEKSREYRELEKEYYTK